MNEHVNWQIYRDESDKSLPQKLMELVAAYKQKTGLVPTYIGLPPSMMTVENKVRELGAKFAVRTVVPAWAKHEIWLGNEVKHE